MRRGVPFFIGVILAAASVACSSGPAKQVALSNPSTARPSPTATNRTSTQATSTPDASSRSATPTASPKGSSAPSGPFVFPLSGTISPACVRPGQQATIVVQTLTKSAVAFDTFYSDGRSGGNPPYGDGLGGNASGLTDENGRYTSTWLVSAAAPAGKAYARVVAGHGDKTKETRVPFAVSNALGDC
jgi:hypothetical protein